MYPKEDYINIVKTLPFMMIEILFIYSCDEIFQNKFWKHFEWCTPFKQDDSLKKITSRKS